MKLYKVRVLDTEGKEVWMQETLAVTETQAFNRVARAAVKFYTQEQVETFTFTTGQ